MFGRIPPSSPNLPTESASRGRGAEFFAQLGFHRLRPNSTVRLQCDAQDGIGFMAMILSQWETHVDKPLFSAGMSP